MQDALAWLFSLADQERGVGWNPRANPASQWKLGRTRALLDLAGAPDRRLKVVLVAGTKGKGSTCAMLASVLGAAGLRCGLFTKPHLQTYRERIRVDGRAIAPEYFAGEVDGMRRLTSELPPDAGEPTTFEVTVALALHFFAEQSCEVAIVEVGLGGRLDATNATDPDVSVITAISYDHTAILGHTLGAIAGEKAGILRPGRPALFAEQRPTAMRTLRAACRKVGASCCVVPPLVRELPLAGAHQLQNAALAIAAARLIEPLLPEAAIDFGLARVHWPGRFEVINVQGREYVLDGAHNDASAVALAETLASYAAGRPITLVVGINHDKDARAVLRPLLLVADRVVATQTRGNPRALPADELASACRRLGVEPETEPDLAHALNRLEGSARTVTGSSRDLVCVTGSLMLVGQARAILRLPAPEQLW